MWRGAWSCFPVANNWGVLAKCPYCTKTDIPKTHKKQRICTGYECKLAAARERYHKDANKVKGDIA